MKNNKNIILLGFFLIAHNLLSAAEGHEGGFKIEPDPAPVAVKPEPIHRISHESGEPGIADWLSGEALRPYLEPHLQTAVDIVRKIPIAGAKLAPPDDPTPKPTTPILTPEQEQAREAAIREILAKAQEQTIIPAQQKINLSAQSLSRLMAKANQSNEQVTLIKAQLIALEKEPVAKLTETQITNFNKELTTINQKMDVAKDNRSLLTPEHLEILNKEITTFDATYAEIKTLQQTLLASIETSAAQQKQIADLSTQVATAFETVPIDSTKRNITTSRVAFLQEALGKAQTALTTITALDEQIKALEPAGVAKVTEQIAELQSFITLVDDQIKTLDAIPKPEPVPAKPEEPIAAPKQTKVPGHTILQDGTVIKPNAYKRLTVSEMIINKFLTKFGSTETKLSLLNKRLKLLIETWPNSKEIPTLKIKINRYNEILMDNLKQTSANLLNSKTTVKNIQPITEIINNDPLCQSLQALISRITDQTVDKTPQEIATITESLKEAFGKYNDQIEKIIKDYSTNKKPYDPSLVIPPVINKEGKQVEDEWDLNDMPLLPPAPDSDEPASDPDEPVQSAPNPSWATTQDKILNAIDAGISKPLRDKDQSLRYNAMRAFHKRFGKAELKIDLLEEEILKAENVKPYETPDQKTIASLTKKIRKIRKDLKSAFDLNSLQFLAAKTTVNNIATVRFLVEDNPFCQEQQKIISDIVNNTKVQTGAEIRDDTARLQRAMTAYHERMQDIITQHQVLDNEILEMMKKNRQQAKLDATKIGPTQPEPTRLEVIQQGIKYFEKSIEQQEAFLKQIDASLTAETPQKPASETNSGETFTHTIQHSKALLEVQQQGDHTAQLLLTAQNINEAMQEAGWPASPINSFNPEETLLAWKEALSERIAINKIQLTVLNGMDHYETIAKVDLAGGVTRSLRVISDLANSRLRNVSFTVAMEQGLKLMNALDSFESAAKKTNLDQLGVLEELNATRKLLLDAINTRQLNELQKMLRIAKKSGSMNDALKTQLTALLKNATVETKQEPFATFNAVAANIADVLAETGKSDTYTVVLELITQAIADHQTFQDQYSKDLLAMSESTNPDIQRLAVSLFKAQQMNAEKQRSKAVFDEKSQAIKNNLLAYRVQELTKRKYSGIMDDIASQVTETTGIIKGTYDGKTISESYKEQLLKARYEKLQKLLSVAEVVSDFSIDDALDYLKTQPENKETTELLQYLQNVKDLQRLLNPYLSDSIEDAITVPFTTITQAHTLMTASIDQITPILATYQKALNALLPDALPEDIKTALVEEIEALQKNIGTYKAQKPTFTPLAPAVDLAVTSLTAETSDANAKILEAQEQNTAQLKLYTDAFTLQQQIDTFTNNITSLLTSFNTEGLQNDIIGKLIDQKLLPADASKTDAFKKFLDLLSPATLAAKITDKPTAESQLITQHLGDQFLLAGIPSTNDPDKEFNLLTDGNAQLAEQSWQALKTKYSYLAPLEESSSFPQVWTDIPVAFLQEIGHLWIQKNEKTRFISNKDIIQNFDIAQKINQALCNTKKELEQTTRKSSGGQPYRNFGTDALASEAAFNTFFAWTQGTEVAPINKDLQQASGETIMNIKEPFNAMRSLTQDIALFLDKNSQESRACLDALTLLQKIGDEPPSQDAQRILLQMQDRVLGGKDPNDKSLTLTQNRVYARLKAAFNPEIYDDSGPVEVESGHQEAIPLSPVPVAA